LVFNNSSQMPAGSAANPCADGHKGPESPASLDHGLAHIVDQLPST